MSAYRSKAAPLHARVHQFALHLALGLVAFCGLAAAQQHVPLGRAAVWPHYAQFDTGPLPPSTQLPHVTIVLRPRASANLQQLLFALQDPRSPQYHRWLTPEQFAARFGAAPEALSAVQRWLAQGGVVSSRIARGGLWISFSTTAATANAMFHADLRRLSIGGHPHFANRAPISLPPSLAPFIAEVTGLDDFGEDPQTLPSSQSAAAQLAPSDLANVYGFASLHAGGITGSGISVAVLGRTPVEQEDVRAYRARFGLSQNDFRAVAVPSSSGTMAAADQREATFDLEIAAAAAPDASLLYVWASTLDAAAEWAIDNRLADVLSESYAGCENSGDVLYQTLAMQAAAEGITWVAAAGDSGPAACDPAGSAAAQNGLHAAAPASTPGITAVGGTALTSGGLLSGASGSAAESAWNSGNSVAAGGGGISTVFGMPGYQSEFTSSPTGRMLPDVAFAASPASAPYAVIFAGQAEFAGGTSLAAPLFAGMLALVNQYLLAEHSLAPPGLGEINPVLYRLSELSPSVFHDVTTGSNDVPCTPQSADCESESLGYRALPGYDLATGLGSLDAAALAQSWTAADFASSTVTLTGPTAPISPQQPAQIVATVASGGSPLAGSPVQFYVSNAASPSNQLLVATVLTDSTGVARLTTAALPAGVNNIEVLATGTTSVLPAPPQFLSVTVTAGAVAAPDFQITGPSLVSIAPGSSVTAPLTLSPLNGFQQPVQLTCASSSPLATCTVPQSITPTSATQIPLTVALSSASLQPAVALLLFALPLMLRRRRALFAAVLLVAILPLSDCGTAATVAPAATGFSIIVTATSPTATHSVTLPVQISQR